LAIGLAVATALGAYVDGAGAALVVLVGVTVSGGLIGAAVLGGVGQEVARGLYHLRLGVVDRFVGATVSAVGAAVACALVVHVLALAAPHSSISRAAGHDAIAHLLGQPGTVLWI
jgi:hypothetical protein